ncbi:hypothetical protein [Shinella sp.]|uniref:hypothetical protein n=1 Tax=Shinella sp. TaxID=1870904 RepID=UPI0029B06C76|nr:hypothetical protein [Shinella sp.]MDX3977158.1 hypothetical protein [Shinella sp.]
MHTERSIGLTCLDDRIFALKSHSLVQALVSFGDSVISYRPIDSRWQYTDIIQKSLAGFNPLSLKVFVPQISCAALVLSPPAAYEKVLPAMRKYGSTNWLLYDVFYCLHDYVHCRVMAEAAARLSPDLFSPSCVGEEGLRQNILYCLALSEVAATVGLDYWYLCCSEHRQGLLFQNGFTALTTAYTYDEECETPADGFVQSVEFFRAIFSLYMPFRDNHLPNFPETVKTSPWFAREVRQAHLFSRLMDRWLSRLDLRTPRYERRSITSSDELENLRDHIVEQMWRIFKNGELSLFQIPSNPPDPFGRVKFSTAPFDPRFINIRHTPNWKSLPFSSQCDTLSSRQFAYMAAQYVASFDYDKRGSMDASTFDRIVLARDVRALRMWSEPLQPIVERGLTAEHLVFPN